MRACVRACVRVRVCVCSGRGVNFVYVCARGVGGGVHIMQLCMCTVLLYAFYESSKLPLCDSNFIPDPMM